MNRSQIVNRDKHVWSNSSLVRMLFIFTNQLWISHKSRFMTSGDVALQIDGIMPEEQTRQNKIFQEGGSKFFECLAVNYYLISMKLREITKCYSTWNACCFQWYHSFSKFSFILMSRFIRLFVLYHLWTVHPVMMVRYAINGSHLPYFGAYVLLRSK